MNAKEAAVLSESRKALLKLAGERDTLKDTNIKLAAENAAMRTRMRCEKIAHDMVQKDLHSGRDLVELVEDLEKKAHEGKLDVIEEALAMSAPNMGQKIASINDTEVSAGSGTSQFEQYLVGSVG